VPSAGREGASFENRNKEIVGLAVKAQRRRLIPVRRPGVIMIARKPCMVEGPRTCSKDYRVLQRFIIYPER